MFNGLFKSFSVIFILIFILVIFISCFFSPIILSNNNSVLSTENIFFSDISPSGYLWPTPGYTTTVSYTHLDVYKRQVLTISKSVACLILLVACLSNAISISSGKKPFPLSLTRI